MASSPEQQADNLDILRMTVVSLVRSDTRDLTTRQLAVFLTCYLGDEGQTVRGLAAYLDIPKPSISRALDRLAGAKLVKPVPDAEDRRSVLVGKTPAGVRFLHDLKSILQKAAASSQN